MTDQATKVLSAQPESRSELGLIEVTVEGATSDGEPLVRCGAGPRTALCRASVVWMAAAPDWSACKGLRVVVGFESGDQQKPMILGLLDPPPGSAAPNLALVSEAEEPKETRPDVLRLESQEELILECGQAKISLRADGRIVILGGYVLSRSRGVNKIKGGSVQIN